MKETAIQNVLSVGLMTVISVMVLLLFYQETPPTNKELVSLALGVLLGSMKDVFNASPPDQDGQFLSYVTEPLLPIYMEAILGVPNPGPYSVGLGIGGREDLVWAFLTGIPGLTQPAGFSLGAPIPGEPGKSFGAFEALRLNLTQPASSFPNGRAVGDDVVDIALSAMAGLLIDGTFIPDGVDSNGLSYLTTFPYLGDPWSGDDHPQGFHDL